MIYNISSLVQDYKIFSESILDLEINTILEQWTAINYKIEECFATIYIDYTCDTSNEKKMKALNEITKAQEEFTFYHHKIVVFILDHFDKYDKDLSYAIKIIKNERLSFCKANLPLETQIQNLSQEYQQITGSLTASYFGKELPLSKLKPFLESTQQKERKEAFEKTRQAYFKVHTNIDKIFQEQVFLRHKTAQNAGFKNFRDYMHLQKNRFSYTPEDCQEFNKNILTYIVPLASKLASKRKEYLKLNSLKPYDLSVDILNRKPLKISINENKEEFLTKTLALLELVDPKVHDTLKNLEKSNNLDLFARKNKAPGGYNFPLPLSLSSFIFMNCSFTHGDLQTLIHEAGHAYHFDCYKNNKESFLYKSPPSEVAELASMTMELMSSEHWQYLYPQENDLKQAKLQQIESIIYFFPWMATVDAFQQWVYTNPEASIEERNTYFKDLYTQYHPYIDWSEYESFLPYLWHKQLHIIEVPFYYIEYGIAQLGALQIWKNYKKNPSQAFSDYTSALKCGSSQPMGEIYNKAGIKMDFSASTIKDVATLLESEINL